VINSHCIALAYAYLICLGVNTPEPQSRTEIQPGWGYKLSAQNYYPLKKARRDGVCRRSVYCELLQTFAPVHQKIRPARNLSKGWLAETCNRAFVYKFVFVNQNTNNGKERKYYNYLQNLFTKQVVILIFNLGI